MVTSALWVIRPALVELFTAEQVAPVVYDGPRPRGEQPKEFLLVGASSMEDDAAPAMRAVQGPSSMADAWRDEVGEIDCTAVAWTGDNDMTLIRAAAKSTVDRCEVAINADPSLGGLTVLNSNLIELTGLDVRESRHEKGPFVEAIFTVSYRALLT